MSKSPQGTTSSVIALIGNLLVTIAKFAGAILTQSSVMFSEAVHSLADVLNQALLVAGVKISSRPADKNFNSGYHQARYVFNFSSAAGVLFIGFGVTAYHSLHGLWEYFQGHTEFQFAMINIYILLFSLVLELVSLTNAFKEMKEIAGTQPIREYMKESGDPTIMAIMYEDGAAVLGILIAFTALGLAKVTGQGFWDPLGSLFVAAMLGYVAISLMRLNAGFLMDKAIPERKRQKVLEILEQSPYVEKVLELKTAVLSNIAYRIEANIKPDVDILPGVNAERLVSPKMVAQLLSCSNALIVDDLEQQIKAAVPEVAEIAIEFQWETQANGCDEECECHALCPVQSRLNTAS